MTAVPRLRRFAATIAALGCAAFLLRSQLASAIVTRGDEYLQSGDVTHAVAFYDRARFFDATSPVAAERITFVSTMLKTPAAMRHGLAVADTELAAHPDDLKVRNDRAIMLQTFGRYRDAYADFAILASETNDPHYFEFAAQDAKRAGDRVAARRMFGRVIALDPHFEAARRALAELREE